jgi:hypothetical protein
MDLKYIAVNWDRMGIKLQKIKYIAVNWDRMGIKLQTIKYCQIHQINGVKCVVLQGQQ